MKSYFNKIKTSFFKKNSFISNFTYSSGKNIIGNLIQLAFAPLIVRLYSPESYGYFGFIISVTSFLLPLAALQYDRAVFMTRSKEELDELSHLLFALPVLFATVVLIVLAATQEHILQASNMSGLGNWIFVIPLLIIVSSWASTSQQLLAANYKYKQGFLIGLFPMLIGKSIALGFAFFIQPIFTGLVLSEFTIKIGVLITNFKIILNKSLPIFSIIRSHRRTHYEIAKRYSNFPKIELPAVGIHVLARQIPLLWIPQAFGTAAFGYYALAISLMEVPMRLLGYSLTGVYFQKAISAFRTGGITSVRAVTLRSVIFLTTTSFAPLIVIGYFSYDLFVWLFGSEWSASGSIAQRLCIAYAVRIVVEPIGVVWRVLGEQKKYLIFNTIFLVIRALVMLLGLHLKVDLLTAITMYAIADALGYLAMGLITAHRLWISEGNEAIEQQNPDLLPGSDSK